MNKLVAKPVLIFLFVVVLSGCGAPNANETAQKVVVNALDSTAHCASEYTYGGRMLCMPSLTGFEEAHADTSVAQRFKPLNDGNLLLALYLRANDLDSLRANEAYIFDDYYKVFAFRKKSGYFANDAAVSEAEVANMEELKRSPRIDVNDLAMDLLPERALMMEQYRTDDYLTTSVHVVKVGADGSDKIAIFTMNTLAIRTKLVFFSYYMFYEGAGSISEAKKRNDQFGKALLEANY